MPKLMSLIDGARMELLTPRLRLREFHSADWQDVHEYNADPEVFRYLPSDAGTTADAHALIQWCLEQAQVEPRLIYDFAVVLAAEQKVIGW